MRGRRPKPTVLHELHGNPSRINLRNRELIAGGALADPPVWLTESQRAGWAYAVTHAPRRLLRKIDSAALTVFIVAEDIHRQAVTAQAGAAAEAREVLRTIADRQATVMLKAAAQLGFTPRARRNLVPEGAP